MAPFLDRFPESIARRHHAPVSNVTNKVIAVVGATGALGHLIAEELRDRGATVLGAGRSGPDIVLDIRDSRAGEALVRQALGTQGHLDGVVIASGIVAFGNLVDTDPITVEELFLTNAIGPLWLASAVLPALAASGGFLACITGVVAEQSLPGMVAYSASKAALSHGLVGLRREARREGVRIIDVRPPHTETGLASRAIAGTAPAFRGGLDARAVARRIVDAIAAEVDEVPSRAFA
jgi:short-subunit dehydrogenase